MLIGCGEDYLLLKPAEDYIANWKALINRFAKWRFNTIRLAARFPDAPYDPSTAESPLDYDKYEQVLNLLSQHGIKAVADCAHNYKSMYGWFGSDAWINDWVAFANRFNGDKRILAYELFNEPGGGALPSGMTKEGVVRALAKCTDAIRQVEPERTVVWSPDPYWGTYIPPDVMRENVIYSEHAWIWESNVETAIQRAKNACARFDTFQKTYQRIYGHLWLSEFGSGGGLGTPEETYAAQKAYCVTLINYCLKNNVGFSLWLYSKNSWHPPSGDDILASSDYPAYLRKPLTLPILLAASLVTVSAIAIHKC